MDFSFNSAHKTKEGRKLSSTEINHCVDIWYKKNFLCILTIHPANLPGSIQSVPKTKRAAWLQLGYRSTGMIAKEPVEVFWKSFVLSSVANYFLYFDKWKLKDGEVNDIFCYDDLLRDFSALQKTRGTLSTMQKEISWLLTKGCVWNFMIHLFWALSRFNPILKNVQNSPVFADALTNLNENLLSTKVMSILSSKYKTNLILSFLKVLSSLSRRLPSNPPQNYTLMWTFFPIVEKVVTVDFRSGHHSFLRFSLYLFNRVTTLSPDWCLEFGQRLEVTES